MFQICTISNKPAQYAEMKASLIQAGFDESRCRYWVFDNCAGNCHDPFQTISAVMAEATEPYVIFCHQDILLNHGDGYDQLIRQIEILNRKDPNWAIAGNAGFRADLGYVSKITDPSGCYNQGDLPDQVYSLDENFLVIKTASNLRCSDALHGFHLYATDLCLQAARCGQSSYVIDFHLTHFSKGNAMTADFEQAAQRFKAHWNPYFLFCIIHTPCTFFHLSRSRFLRRLLRSGLLMTWLKGHMAGYRWLAQAKNTLRTLMQPPAKLAAKSPSASRQRSATPPADV